MKASGHWWRVAVWLSAVLAQTSVVAALGPFPIPETLNEVAVLTCEDVIAAGSTVIDSVDLGAGGLHGELGHILSNGEVRLKGAAEVHGDVTVGPGAGVVLKGSAFITGEVHEVSVPVDCRPINLGTLEAEVVGSHDNETIPLTENGKNPLRGGDHRKLVISGNDRLVLPEGTYYLDSISLSGIAEIVPEGVVSILCTGNVIISGASRLNPGGRPEDLRLWVSGNRVKLTGDTFSQGLIYAPDAVASIGGSSQLIGNLAAGELRLSGVGRVSRALDDQEPPEVTIDVPEAECLAAGVSYTIGGAYGDASSPPPGVGIEVGVATSDGLTGAYTGLIGGNGTWTAPNVDLGAGDGSATATVTATDVYGNSSTVERSWRIDASAPVVQLLLDGVPFPGAGPGDTPPPGAEPFVIGRTLTAGATVADPPFAGALQAELTLDGVPYAAGAAIADEGQHLLVTTAIDCAGHIGAAHALFLIDLSPPEITTYESGVAFLGSLLLGRAAIITADAVDASDVTVAATVDGGAYMLGTPYSEPGEHTLQVTATDAAGNQATTNRTFTIDSEPPEILITEPAPGTVHEGPTVTVTGQVSADAESLTVAGIAAVLSPPAGEWRDFSTAAVPLDYEGENPVLLVATDAVGHETQLEASYQRDSQPPLLNLSSPADGLATRLTSLTITGLANDAHLETITVNGESVAVTADGAFSHLLNLAEGEQQVTVVAVDTLGHSTTESRTVTLDSEAPVIVVTVDGQPLHEDHLTNQALTPVIEVSDATETTTTTTLNAAPFIAGTTIADEGAYLLRVEAVDAAGNPAVLELHFTLDLTGPVISGLSPADGSVLADAAPTLSGACDDATAVTVNALDATISAGAFTFSGITLTDGDNSITVEAQDLAGNTTTAAVVLVLDTDSPTLTVSAPEDGDLIGEAEVLISGVATDHHLQGVTVAGFAASLAGETFHARVPLATEGSNSLNVEATDRAGNTNNLSITVVRDTLAPDITITAPGPSAVLSERTFTVTGVASDAHLESVTVSAQPAEIGSDGGFTATLTLPEGRHTLVVVATDSLGHRHEVERLITIDSSAPEVSIDEPAPGSVISETSLTVTGSIADPTEIESLTVNGVLVTIGVGGHFSHVLELAEGDTDIIVRATDAAGNSGVASVTVSVDTTPPEIVGVVPSDGSTSVPPSANLRATFSEAVDADTLAGAILLQTGSESLSVDLSLEHEGTTLVIVPVTGLVSDAEHQLEITTGVLDRAGHALETALLSTFSTSDATPPDPPVVNPLTSPVCFTNLQVGGSAEPGVTVTARGAVHGSSTTAGPDGSFTLDLEPTVGSGPVTFEIFAVDEADNVSTPVALAVELDCGAPYVVTAGLDGVTDILVRFSEILDPVTCVAGSGIMLDGANGPLTFVHTVASAELILELVETPVTEDWPLRLELTSDITDRAGNHALDFTHLFAGPGQTTLVAGEVFSDATSLELGGARITLVEDGVPIPDGTVVVTADGRGRFSLPVIGSPVSVRIEHDGFLPCWRRVVPLPGASTVLFDSRLTAIADATHVDGGAQVAAGSAELVVDVASVPAGGFDIAVTEIGGQGLPALLPLGWRPLAAVGVGVDSVIDPPANLLFTGNVPSDSVIAHFDPSMNSWIVDSYDTTVEVMASGAWALVAPDPEPTAPGLAVVGSTLPSATPTDPGTLAAELVLEPETILPMEQALATVTVTTTESAPSGLAVDALLDEVLHIVDGRTLVAPPTDTDLVLYQSGNGTMVAEFGLGATDAARQLPLDEGVRRVNIHALPPGTRTQDLLGPAGGTIMTSDGLGLDVHPGALDRVVGFALHPFDLAALPLELPNGLEAVAAASLDLGDAELLLPAVLSWPSAGGPDGQYLVLAVVEVDGATTWRLIGEAALDADRIVCDPGRRPDLPAPWVTGSGLYVVVRPTAEDWALISGTVIDVGGAPVSAACAVRATGGLVQLVATADGAYAAAAPAGTVELDAEHLVTRNLGAAQAAPLAGEHLPDIDIQLDITGPIIISTSPVHGAANISASTAVIVDFSEPLDPAGTAGSITVRVIVGTSAPQPWTGVTELAVDGTRLTWTPVVAFPSAAQALVTVGSGISDLQGYPLQDGETTFGFGVERFLLPTDVDISKIRLFMPGRDPAHPGHPVVEGAPGAVPGSIWLWVEDLDHDAPTTTVQAGQDGTFSLLLDPFDGVYGVEVGDRLALHLLAEDPGSDDLAVIPLAPWLTIDGYGAYFGLDGGAFTTTDDVTITVPFAALPEGGSVRATLVDPAAELADPPGFSPTRAGIELELSHDADQRLALVIPGDIPVDTTGTMLVGRLIDVAGTAAPMLVATAHWDDDAGAYRTTVLDESPPGDKSTLDKAAETGMPDAILPGISTSGTYLIFEPILPPGAKAGLAERFDGDSRLLEIDGLTGDLQPEDPEIKALFLDQFSNVAYVNTLYAPVDAVLLARSEGAGGGSWAFSMREAGQATGGGTAKAFTFPHGATVPVRPDIAFDLQVVDEGTGYIYSDEGYPAPTDGWGEIDSDDAPGMDGVPLKIIGGDPFFIISFGASVGNGVPLADGIDYTMAAPDSGLEVSVTSGALPGEPEIRLVNLRNGVSKTLGGGFGDLSFLASEIRIGDPLLLVVEPVLVRGDQALTLRFNKSLDGGGITENDLNLVPLGGATTNAFELDVDGQTIEVRPDPAWQAGDRYELKILPAVFGDGRLGSGQILAQAVSLPLRMAESATGESVLPHETDVADVALEGDVLLVAVRDNGLKAFDISDPTRPRPLGYTDGLVGAGAVASDGFGHVIVVEGTAGEHVAMRLYSLDELIATVEQVGPKASLALSPPMTAVGPGDLEIEVFANTVVFTAAEPEENITVTYDNQADPTEWIELLVPASLLEPNHPVRLVDGLSGAILYRAAAPESGDLVIPNSKNLPLGHPLVLRAHLDTLAWAFASGGVVDAATITVNADFEYGFSLGATSSNTDLLDWVMNHGRVDTCRELNTGDSVYLGRLAVTPRRDQKSVLLSASRFDGLWGFTQDGGTPDTNPDWVQCLRGPVGERLNDVAASSWPVDDGADEAVLVATVGHRELAIHVLTAAQGLNTNLVHVENLEWDPFRVAFDRQNRLVLVRDHNRRLAVYSLELQADKSIELVTIADIELPEGSGLGPLVLDPSLGLAIAGNAPVQYLPPTIELIADTNGDGLPETVDYLQPLGAPMAPVNEGYTPPLLATLRAHVLGVPEGTDEITVRIEGLAPGGAPLPDRPKPFLPSSTRVTLQRPSGLALDDPGRHTFTSTRPILLIADERARTDYWQNLDPETLAKLSASDEGHAVYSLCRNCERDLDGNGSQDVPNGFAAAHLADTPTYPVSGPEPIEIASAGRVRFNIDPPTGKSPSWLAVIAETGQLPTGEVVSVAWSPSPAVKIDQVVDVRAAGAPEVELSSGALSLSRTDLDIVAPGMGVSVGRTYTSGGIHYGLFGWGWQLAGLDRLRPNPDGTVDLYTSGGDRFVFGNEDGHPGALPNTLTALGHPGELKQKADGSWFLLYPDLSYTQYDAAGYPTHHRDRYRQSADTGSELQYHWLANGMLAGIRQVNGEHSTDLHPRGITFTYKKTDGRPTGLVETAEDSTGRAYHYDYDGNGRLTDAWMPGIKLDLAGTTGTAKETYVPELPASALGVDAIETGGEIGKIRDTDNEISLQMAWSEQRVGSLTRGSGDDVIITSISPQPENTWTVTEGQGAPIPTVTTVSFSVDVDDRVQQTTIGQGDDATSATTILDRDGRVTETVDPAGIKTTTGYPTGGRRLTTFSPDTVTTHQGTVGELRPETPPSLYTTYRYYDDTTLVREIDRPGPTGRLITKFGREGAKYPTTVTAPDGTVTQRDYDDLGRVETVTSNTGAVTIITYDDLVKGTGEMMTSTTTTAAGSTVTTLGRDARGYVTQSRTTTTPNRPETPAQPDRVTNTEVNTLGWSLETRTGDSTTRTVYDADGRIDSITSGGGNGDDFAAQSTTVPGYTSAGLIETITRSHNGVTESSGMTYDDAGRLETSATAGLTTTYGYDTAGRTKTRAEGALPDTQYAYDTAGRLETTTTPGGKVSRNVYDLLGRQVGRVDPALMREDLTLTPTGQLRQRKLMDESETIWSWEEYLYDAKGRLDTRTVHRFPVTPTPNLGLDVPLATTTTYYDTEGDPRLGLVHTITDALDRVTAFDYDDAGRETLRTLPDGTEVETFYYPDGKVETRTVRYAGPEGSWQLTTSTTYDEQGRVFTVTGPGGQVTTTFYDELGRKETQLSADSLPDGAGETPVERLTSWHYGDLGRTVTTTRPDGAVITREYDERGNLTAYEDTDNNRTEYYYDGYGRLETILYPGDTLASPGKSFTYHDDGEVETITRADGSVVTFAYEPATGRLDTITVTGGVQPGGVVDFDYDAAGHLTTTFDSDVALAFEWDSVGNQLAESLALPGVAPTLAGRRLTREFDPGNRPETLSFPDGLTSLQRGYDAGDRLDSLTLGSQSIWQATRAGSRLTRIEYGNGLATTYSYDDQGRPTEVLTGTPGTGEAIADPVHRLGLSWTEASLRRSKTRDDLNRRVERFHYDGVGHLESNEIDAIPAIVAANHDLEALSGLSTRSLEEWWTVNTVDELEKRNRTLEGRSEASYPQHNDLHQVEAIGAKRYDWDVNGNLELEQTELPGGSLFTDATYTHDWRDRLVEVEKGDTTTRLVIDPLGRLVAKVKQTPAGDVTRIYLHDGDQVVAEYVQEAGGTGYQLDRKHHWAQWIDDLALEEVDTNHDGALDTTLYPVKDLLGSVQLLTDETGTIVERVEYNADGTPRIYSGDAVVPTVTRTAWTGDGTSPAGVTVDAGVFEVGFSEWIDEVSVASASATLTPEGGNAESLTLTLDVGARGATLDGASMVADTAYTLRLEGLTDRAGNGLEPVDAVIEIADEAVYEVLEDTAAPQVLAVMDAVDGIYLLLDEPVTPAAGVDLADSVTVKRGTSVVAGTTTRVNGQLLQWVATAPADWLVLGDYEVTSTQLADLAGQAVDDAPLPVSLTHLASNADAALVAYEAPGDSQPRAGSAFGLKNLFQGREWHEDLGLYYYRARWYAPGLSSFLERDPFEYLDESNPYSFVGNETANSVDPLGLRSFGHPYNLLTGIQAHLIFSDWILGTGWAEAQDLMGRDIFPNKSLGTVIRHFRGVEPSQGWTWQWMNRGSGKWVDTLVKRAYRPDALSVGPGGIGGELLELKPITYWENPVALADTLIKIAAEVAYLGAHGVRVQLGDLTRYMPEMSSGVTVPGRAVLDTDNSLYTVKFISPGASIPGMVFYELLGGASEEIRETVPSWVRSFAPRLRSIELNDGLPATSGFSKEQATSIVKVAIACGMAQKLLPYLTKVLQGFGTAATVGASTVIPPIFVVPPEFLPPGSRPVPSA